jgi:type IV pilus assembly protein PilF
MKPCMTSKGLFSILFMAWLLVACGSNPNHDDSPSSGDIAGELGNPVHHWSPADVYVELGTAYLNAGQINEAFLNARKAMLVDENSSTANNLLAVIYQRLGKIKLARKHYGQAISLDKKNAYALNGLGQFLCAQGEYTEAQKYFKRALGNPLYPTPWIALHNVAACYEKAKNIPRAEQAYRDALKGNAQFAPSLLGMAQLNYNRGDYLSARVYIQRYAQISRHTAESLWLGVQTEKQLDDRLQMEKYKLQLKREFPDSEQAKSIT